MKFSTTIFFSVIISICQAQTIPVDRIFNWTNSGYQGTYPINAVQIDFLTVGGVNDLYCIKSS